VDRVKVTTIPSVITFKTLTGILETNEKNLKAFLGLWNFSGNSNPVREFLYKFCFNQLGLNTRVSHFVDNHPRHCTLCSVAGVPVPIPDETFKHLFFECPTVKQQHESLIRKYFSQVLPATEQEKLKIWFLGETGGKCNLFFMTAIILFQFLIWKQKLQKEIKPFSTLEQNWLYMLDVAFKCSKKIRDAIMQINFTICRRWHREDG